MNFKRVPFSHTQNTRDLGGYATKDGVTRYNVFFRSALPVDFSQEDLHLAEEMNLGAVVDLRGGTNIDESMPVATFPEGVKRYHFPLGNGKIPRYAKDVPQSYMEITTCTQSLNSIFHLFADEQKAVMFHCFAGKDRTGLIAAMLLMLAGVDEVDIVADYSLTYPYFLPRLRRDFFRLDAEKYVFVPIPEHMEGFLKLFYEKYGSIQSFLLGIGIDEATQQKILQKFVEK